MRKLKKQLDAAQKAAREAAAKAKLNEKKFAEPQGPIEPASKDDFQFNQAMNLLKGLPVSKAPEVKSAEVKADAVKPAVVDEKADKNKK